MATWVWIALFIFVLILVVGSYLYLQTMRSVTSSGAWLAMI
jgi:uncharacterized protein YpmB